MKAAATVEAKAHTVGSGDATAEVLVQAKAETKVYAQMRAAKKPHIV